MSTIPIRLLAALGAASLGGSLAGCIVPPPLNERWSPSPTQESWQQQGRFRPSDQGASASTPAPVEPRPAAVSDPLANGSLENSIESVPPNPKPQEPPPYAWDGGVVDGAPQGRVVPQEGTPRGLEEPASGRTHIIELYQQVLEERDALAARVDKLEKNHQETELVLAAKSKEAEQLTERVDSLEAAHKDLLDQNQALGARLVQAQIRRLEAEKLLLEAHIETERVKAAEAARAAAAVVRPNASAVRPAPKSGGGERE